MTVKVGIVENPLDPKSWRDTEVEDVCAFLSAEFASWPEGACIYDLEGFGGFERVTGQATLEFLAGRDVTPRDEAGVQRLQGLAGPLLVVVAPADPTTAIIVAIAIGFALAAAAYFLLPRPPDVSNTYQSPNNSLSERTNRPRPNGRIPDIFGTVRATPDLIAVPYKTFENNIEVEIAYMCVGRGEYEIYEVRDGDTLISSIAGSSAIIYGPNTSPNSGAPQLSIGGAIDDPVLSVVRMNDVNGQVLRPPNANTVNGENNIRFHYPDLIETNDGDLDFTKYFAAGDVLNVAKSGFTATTGGTFVSAHAKAVSATTLDFDTYNPTVDFAVGEDVTLSNAVFVFYDSTGNATHLADLTGGPYTITALTAGSMTLDSPATINPNWNEIAAFPGGETPFQYITIDRSGGSTDGTLDGSYPVLAVTAATITLDNPEAINPTWLAVQPLAGSATAYLSPTLSTNGIHWVGPFVVDLDDLDRVLGNFVAMAGLYKVSSKGNQHAMFVTAEIELTPVDQTDTPTGPAETFNVTLGGSDTNKEQVGASLMASPSFTGRCSVRARRTSPTLVDYEGTVVDEIKWRDGYGLAAVAIQHFGNLTTVHARTYGTSGATSVKERKLNCKVRRKIKPRIGATSDFSDSLVGSDSVADILCFLALDPYIGNRSTGQLDVDGIYAAVADVAAYFGTSRAAQFGYTFDDDNLSFEETLQTVARAVFCFAYRQGVQIKLTFEQATEQSVLLFNHRNTLPGTQKRTVTFGVNDDHDGVEVDYVAEADGAPVTYAIPANRSALSPLKVQPQGVRTFEQAYWQAWRAWSRLQYQNQSVEQECTQEAALVLPSDRVLITDQTRPPGFEGEVLGQVGLDLLLSQPTVFAGGVAHTIFVQHPDATIEALPVSAWVPPGGWVQGEGEYPAENWVTLGAASSQPLLVDPALSARTTYEIVPATDQRSRAYLVAEREPQSNFTETLRAINYSWLYYQGDQIVLWLPFSDQSFYDQSPWQRDGEVISGAPDFVVDDEREKFVYRAAAAGAVIDFDDYAPPDSYTKAAWVYRTAGHDSDLIYCPTTGERFGFDAAGHLLAGHGAPTVGPVVVANEWHHVVAVYAGGTIRKLWLYIDGVQVAYDPVLLRGGRNPLRALRDFIGRVDDLRLWSRAFSASDVRSLFAATRKGFSRPPVLATETGGILTTEDGSQITLE